jgi:hypothetical protein
MMDLPIQYAFMFFNFALAFTYKAAQKSFLKDGNKVNNPAAETAGCYIHKMSVNWGDR